MMEIRLNRLINSDWDGLDVLLEQYVALFPEAERIETEKIKYLIDNQTGCFDVIVADDIVSGFAYHWDIGGARYLLYLMVLPEFHNKKIGSQVVRKLISAYEVPWFLEVEPANNEINTRRIKLYERCGLRVVAKNPELLYEGRGRKCELWVMSTRDHDHMDSYLQRILDVVHEAVV